MRSVKQEVKKELKEARDENAGLQYQVGLNEGKVEVLARENEVLVRKNEVLARKNEVLARENEVLARENEVFFSLLNSSQTEMDEIWNYEK